MIRHYYCAVQLILVRKQWIYNLLNKLLNDLRFNLRKLDISIIVSDLYFARIKIKKIIPEIYFL